MGRGTAREAGGGGAGALHHSPSVSASRCHLPMASPQGGFELFRLFFQIQDQCLAIGRVAHPGKGHARRSEERRVGKSVSVRVDLGGRRFIKKNKQYRLI